MSDVELVATDSPARDSMTPSNYVTPETLREGDPAEHHTVHLSTEDSKFSVGSWRAQPYAEFIESYPGDEFTHVIEGTVVLTGDDGVANTFTAGDSYTLRRGWRGEFRVTEPLLKQFAIYVP
jgi:uncharacterized cupin superfamily protein